MLKYLNGINQQNNNYMNDYEISEVGKVKLKLKVPPVVKKATEKAISKLPPKAQAQVKKITNEIKKAGANIKTATKKMNLATIPLAPSRTAFLGLVRLNVLKLADKLVQAENKKPGSVQALWKKMGGDFNVLKNVINQGAKKGKLSGIGAAGEVEAILAAATPIVVAVVGLLTKLGIKKKGQKDELDEAIEQGKEELQNNPDVMKTAGVDVIEGGSGVNVSRPTSESQTSESQTSETETTEKNNMLPILLGVGVVGDFLLLKKKK